MTIDRHSSGSREAGRNDGLPRGNRSERHQGRDGFRFPAWLIPVAAFVVAILVAVTILTLEGYGDESNEAQLVLAQLQETTDQQQLAEFQVGQEATGE